MQKIDEICLGEWWQSKRWLGVSRILVAIHNFKIQLLQLQYHYIYQQADSVNLFPELLL